MFLNILEFGLFKRIRVVIHILKKTILNIQRHIHIKDLLLECVSVKLLSCCPIMGNVGIKVVRSGWGLSNSNARVVRLHVAVRPLRELGGGSAYG